MPDSRQDLLRQAAERAAEQSFFLARPLLAVASAERLTDAALAARLGCSAEALPLLLLCRRPDGTPDRFRADVERIAERFELDATRLAEAIRLGEALEAWGKDSEATSFLAAARDQEPTDPDEDA